MLSFVKLLLPSSLPWSSDATAVSVYSASSMPSLACTPSSVNTAITTTTTAVKFAPALAINGDDNQNKRGLHIHIA
jgi:hypothetical protein